MFLEKEIHWKPRGDFFDLDLYPDSGDYSEMLTVYQDIHSGPSLWRIIRHGGYKTPIYFDMFFDSCDAAKRYCESLL